MNNETLIPHIAAQGFDSAHITDVQIDLASRLFTFKYGAVTYWGKLTKIGLVKKNSIRVDRT